jgi:ankyrin repeat protein
LIHACSSDREDDVIVTWLLDNGAMINLAMVSGWTAAHAAAHSGNNKVLGLLLNRGADRNAIQQFF